MIQRKRIPPADTVEQLRDHLQMLLNDIYRELERKVEKDPGLQSSDMGVSNNLPAMFLGFGG
jgi:hypothetical protein